MTGVSIAGLLPPTEHMVTYMVTASGLSQSSHSSLKAPDSIPASLTPPASIPAPTTTPALASAPAPASILDLTPSPAPASPGKPDPARLPGKPDLDDAKQTYLYH